MIVNSPTYSQRLVYVIDLLAEYGAMYITDNNNVTADSESFAGTALSAAGTVSTEANHEEVYTESITP